MAKTKNSLKTLEICRVPPSPNSPDSATELSLPLTLFDTIWFKFPPVERLFFYSLADSNPDSVLSKLKQSLSQILLHFRPFAGKIVWPSDSPKPLIHYAAGDAVLLTVSESQANFDHLSSRHVREASESRPLVPELNITDIKAPAMAVQITFFPNKGFCIGISTHHAVFDGKTATMFMKSWAYICKHGHNEPLPPELRPFFDRTVIKDPTGLDIEHLNIWYGGNCANSDRSLQVMQNYGDSVPNTVRATFELSRTDIEKLRKKIGEQPVRLSAFVLTCSFLFVCLVKARGGESDRKVGIGFTADYRPRLDPPVPENYAGNCAGPHPILAVMKEFVGEDGVSVVAGKLIHEIGELEKGAVAAVKARLAMMMALPPGTQVVGLAGSNRFGVYGTDFGWGRPEMVEITSIDRTGAISMAESRDGGGGVEVGVVLPKEEMGVFTAYFLNGLKDLC